ncbi:acyl-CoA dehydrogenase family protein [Arthrobacter monumenti]
MAAAYGRFPDGEATDFEELADRFRPIFEEIAAGAVQREASRELPFDSIKRLNAAGFGALRVPREHNGFGVSFTDFIQLLIELAQADSNVAHIYRSHYGFVEQLSFAPDRVKDVWYPRIVKGQIVGNASTERGGNALGTMNTLISKTDDGPTLNGQKYYSTGSIFSEWIAVTAAVEGQDERVYALVSTADPNVLLDDDWDGFGQRLTGTGTTTFRNVKVEDDHVLDRSRKTSHEQSFFQLIILAVEAGIARAVLADARSLVESRQRTFNTGSGVPVREDPLILQLVGQISAKAFAAEAIVLQAARELDIARDPSRNLTDQQRYERGELAVDKAQLMVPRLALDAADQLFDTLGASATSRSKQLDRHWRNARTAATHNPIVFKAKQIGDFEVNGTTPQSLWAIGSVG